MWVEKIVSGATAVWRRTAKQRKTARDSRLSFVRELFKASLLHRHTMSAIEIEDRLRDFGIAIHSRDLKVIALKTEGRGNPKQRMIETIVRSGLFESDYFIAEPVSRCLVVVAHQGSIGENRVSDLAERLVRLSNPDSGVVITAGISRSCVCIDLLPEAFGEAMDALKQRIVLGNGRVIRAEDLYPADRCEFGYPKDKEEALLLQLQSDHPDEAYRIFEEIMIDLATSQLHYYQVRLILIRLLNAVFSNLGDSGAVACMIVEEGNDLGRVILEEDDPNAIREMFGKLFERVAAYYREEANQKGSRHVSRITEMIESEYAEEDLTLASLSDRLNLNPSYVSRLFKQAKGQSIVGYIKQLRVEKSKELLLSGEMKVSEVGRSVGFCHTYYFIRVFKEAVGIPPGEYKRIFGNG